MGMDLANALRKNGVEANIDRFLTQTSTVNLNTMMITNMKKNDFVIVVLTETFAEKADDFKGGVGFETILIVADFTGKIPKKFNLYFTAQG